MAKIRFWLHHIQFTTTIAFTTRVSTTTTIIATARPCHSAMIYFKSQTLSRPTLDSTKRLSRLKAHEHYNGLSAYVLPRKQIGTLRLKRST